MNPGNDRAPDADNTRGGSGRAGTSTIAPDSEVSRLWLHGCPAGCGPVHECGVREPLSPLPPPGPRERGGRDLTIQQRDAIAAQWLLRRWVA